MTIEPIWLMSQAVALVISGIVAYNRITERVIRLEAQVHDDLFERVVSLEAIFKLIGEKAAKILHSDDDPHGIDILLDKYIDRHYELSHEEWRILFEKCTLIENDKALAKGERILASWLSAVASHKLRLPPPDKKE